MSNGPRPSERCLLSALCDRRTGEKVRFLGCVTGYSAHCAHITLKHSFPKKSSHVEALVDVKLLLETLKFEQIQMGQWVHVIGYLTFISPEVLAPATGPRDSSRSKATTQVSVQALVFWVARDLDLAVYEKSMLLDTDQNTASLALRN
ncbi:CST complex subunit Ten1 [Xylaria palmicola]|nr:CST complex subunit Ten1 [Xylaria palmicola]